MDAKQPNSLPAQAKRVLQTMHLKNEIGNLPDKQAHERDLLRKLVQALGEHNTDLKLAEAWFLGRVHADLPNAVRQTSTSRTAQLPGIITDIEPPSLSYTNTPVEYLRSDNHDLNTSHLTPHPSVRSNQPGPVSPMSGSVGGSVRSAVSSLSNNSARHPNAPSITPSQLPPVQPYHFYSHPFQTPGDFHFHADNLPSWKPSLKEGQIAHLIWAKSHPNHEDFRQIWSIEPIGTFFDCDGLQLLCKPSESYQLITAKRAYNNKGQQTWVRT